MSVGSDIKLITIGQPDTRMTQSPKIQLAPLDGNSLDAVLKENVPNLWPEARRVVVDMSVGNVGFALVSAQAVSRQDNLTAADLITSDIVKSFITKELPDGTVFLGCSALALFTRLGFERELGDELTLVANRLGLRVLDLRAAARQLATLGLLTSSGRYRSVGPHPLAVYLAAEAWRIFGDQIAGDLLPSLPPDMVDRLFERAAEIGQLAGGVTAIDRLLDAEGPLASLDALEASGNTRLLTHLAVLAPDELSRRLSRLILSADIETLRSQTSSRRELVWSLQKLAWHAKTFEAAADSMLRLAMAENETWSNNASGIWKEFFGTWLPGTAARPAARLRYLQERAASESPEARLHIVRACAAALSRQASIMVSGEIQGGVVVETRGSPATWGDVWDYQRGVIALLRTLADDPRENVANEAIGTLVQSIHPLLEDPHVRGSLFESLASLPSDALRRVHAEIESLTALFDRVEKTDRPRADALEQLRSILPGLSHAEELAILARMNPWDLRDGALGHRIESLAEQMKDGEAVAQLKSILAQDELPSAFEIGRSLASIAGNTDTLQWLAENTIDRNLPTLVGYLWGKVERGDQEAFDNFLSVPLGNSLPERARLDITA
jgi:hypothetical protein